MTINKVLEIIHRNRYDSMFDTASFLNRVLHEGDSPELQEALFDVSKPMKMTDMSHLSPKNAAPLRQMVNITKVEGNIFHFTYEGVDYTNSSTCFASNR